MAVGGPRSRESWDRSGGYASDRSGILSARADAFIGNECEGERRAASLEMTGFAWCDVCCDLCKDAVCEWMAISAVGRRKFCLGLRAFWRRWRWGDLRGGGGRFRRPLGRRRRLLWRRWGLRDAKREKPQW